MLNTLVGLLFAFAVMTAWGGLRNTVSLESKEKIEKLMAQLEAEITSLKITVDARLDGNLKASQASSRE